MINYLGVYAAGTIAGFRYRREQLLRFQSAGLCAAAVALAFAGPPDQASVHPSRNLTATAANTWIPLGPVSGLLPSFNPSFGTPSDRSGRITAIALHPTNSKIIYAGGELGGVWKTIDGGASWTPLTDFQPSLATGSIAIDRANPNVVYVGTGASDSSGYNYYGVGVLKTTDGGSSFVQYGADTFRGLSIARLLIDPTNSRVIYAATSMGFAGAHAHLFPPDHSPFGVYKSVDGGVTWTRLAGLLSGPVRDLKLDPTDPKVLYAALDFSAGLNGVSGIYKTADAGTTWKLLGGVGFPNSGFGKVSLAVAPGNSQILYAALSATAFGADLLSILKSVDGGVSWTPTARPVSGYGSPTLCTCDFANVLAVSPTDPDLVFWGGTSLYRSTDGGASWRDATRSSQSADPTTGGGMQGDVHAVEFDPAVAGRVVVGSDGGVFGSVDAGASWLHNLNGNLAITEFYRIAIHPTDDDFVLGGAQDKGAVLRKSDAGWNYLSFGDGGDMKVDYENPSVLYHPDIFMSFERSDDGGRSFQAKETGLNQSDRSPFGIIMPVAIDPSNPSTLYLASYRLYKTTNRGDAWQPISGDLTNGGSGDAISTIAVSKSSARTLYIGTSDGNVQVTTDGGTTFRNLHSGLPAQFISRIVVDPVNSQVAYLSVSGFGRGHIFKTVNGGSTWIDISGNLPDSPFNALEIDASNPKTIFAGGDAGVYTSTDGNVSWTKLGATSLPNAPVFDLKWSSSTGSLFAATFGRGVFRLAGASSPLLVPPAVTSISPTALKQGQKVDVSITGSGLTGAQLAVAPPEGISISIVSATPTSITATFAVAPTAVTGDRIATISTTGGSATVRLSITADTTLPVITSVVNGASFLSAPLAPNTWFSVLGVNLGSQESAPEGLANSLGGADITICGASAMLNFNSGAGQINALTPNTVTGKDQCPVIATVAGRTSQPFAVPIASDSLGIFLYSLAGTTMPVATHVDYSVIGPVSAGLEPAVSGETVILWCTGWNSGSANPTVLVGGLPARLVYFGPSGSSPGLCQINIELPAGLNGQQSLRVGGLPPYTLPMK